VKFCKGGGANYFVLYSLSYVILYLCCSTHKGSVVGVVLVVVLSE
jgi:hypothetical protein